MKDQILLESVYSFTSSPVVPTTNIFVPSLLNVIPLRTCFFGVNTMIEGRAVLRVPTLLVSTLMFTASEGSIFACSSGILRIQDAQICYLLQIYHLRVSGKPKLLPSYMSFDINFLVFVCQRPRSLCAVPVISSQSGLS